jgi:hypothetical protein
MAAVFGASDHRFTLDKPLTQDGLAIRALTIATRTNRAESHGGCPGGSKVDDGVHPDQRLVTFMAVLRRIKRRFPVIAWQQGVLGEAAVAAGAIGYETGLGWRERCDLQGAMSAHRQPPSGNFGARPVYIPALNLSFNQGVGVVYPGWS